MPLRERENQAITELHGPPPGAPAGGNLEGIRQAGESLFRAADDAIHRALSGDSLAFLQATEQEGGQ
jgi:hypothetical protein